MAKVLQQLKRKMILQTGNKFKKQGFTLLETIIVIAIITLFFAISVPLFSKFTESAKLDTTARSITSALRTARSYAISKNTEYYVFFKTNTQPHQYFISDSNIGDLSNPSVSVIEKVYKLPTGIEFGNIDFTKGTTADGACFESTGGLDETNNETSVELTDGTNSITITVERTTGRVKID